MTALNELLSRAADPARKHAAGSSAHGKWLTITATPALIAKVKAEDKALRELAKELKAALRVCLPAYEAAQMRTINNWQAADASVREAEANMGAAALARRLLK